MSEDMSYQEAVKAVFANRAGERLMEIWQLMYGDQISYVQGVTTHDMAFNEGHRAFYLTIKTILEDTK